MVGGWWLQQAGARTISSCAGRLPRWPRPRAAVYPCGVYVGAAGFHSGAWSLPLPVTGHSVVTGEVASVEVAN